VIHEFEPKQNCPEVNVHIVMKASWLVFGSVVMIIKRLSQSCVCVLL